MQPIISYKQIGKLALPIIISQSVVLINGMIDLAFIGPLGTNAIAAVSVANAICATLFNFLEGFRIGTTVLISKAAADKDPINGTSIFNAAVFLVLMISAAIAICAPTISSTVYSFIDNEQIRIYGVDYLKIWLWTVPIILLSYVLVGLFRGLKDTATPLYSTFIICVLNVLFSYTLVYGGFGFPALGVKGSALGSLFANLVGLLLLIFLAYKRQVTAEYIHYQRSFFRQLPEYVKLAADIGLNTGFTLLALLIFIFIIKQLGATALAVHQITLQVFNFTYLPTIGFLITASIILPRLLVNQQLNLVVPTVNRICRMSFGFVFVTCAIIFWQAHHIAGFFSPTDQTAALLAEQTIKLVCIGQLFSALYMVLRGALTACRDTRFIVYEGLVTSYLVFLPTAYLLAIQLKLGLIGGFIAFVLWCISDCTVLGLRFYLQKVWRHINS